MGVYYLFDICIFFFMKIILTGATGTLGSQVLFTLLNTRLKEIDTIILLVRKKKMPLHNKESIPFYIAKQHLPQ